MWHATVSCVMCYTYQPTERLQWLAYLLKMKSPLFTLSFHPFLRFQINKGRV
jgi:hypothetical protein